MTQSESLSGVQMEMMKKMQKMKMEMSGDKIYLVIKVIQ